MKPLSEKFGKRGLEYIWHDPKENDVGNIHNSKGRCSVTERQNLFENIRKKKTNFYYDMKI
jgi:hypothetical protein